MSKRALNEPHASYSGFVPGSGHSRSRHKGRGSGSNEPSRYVPLRPVEVEDEWPGTEETPISKYPTYLLADRTRTLITRNNSPDVGFNQSINPYKGCEHGCIYCFARPTHAYLDLSPGLDFESRIFYKTDVRRHLLSELAAPGYRCSTLAIGTNTDPYQPAERSRKVMREILEVLLECHHPVSIVTKSKLILRDIDLLKELASRELIQIHVSVTTLDNRLKAKLEPRTAAPGARLRVISELRRAGVPTGAMLAPLIPFINDHEIEALVAACAEAGAQTLGYILIRLPLEVRPLFAEWLEHHYPLKARRVMAAIRDTRGGHAYNPQWHTRMVGEGQIAELIGQRLSRAIAGVGLADAGVVDLRTDGFIQPRHPDDLQMELF